MRFLMIVTAATLLLLPVAQQAKACGAAKAQAAATDLSAKKNPKAKKEKVEYMRAAPMK